MRSLPLIVLFLCVSFSQLSAQRLTVATVNGLAGAGAQVKTNRDNFIALDLSGAGVDSPNGFLARFGGLLGVAPGDGLTVTETSRGVDGATYVRCRQERNGAPILGGEVTFRLSSADQPQMLSGYLAPATAFPQNPAPAAAPSYTETELAGLAKTALTDKYPQADDWNARVKGPIWVSPNPWSGQGGLRLTTAFEISEPGGHLAETVYVDRQTGKIIFQHQQHCDLTRKLYHAGITPGNLRWSEGNVFPGNLDAEDQEMLNATEDVYHLYHRTFGRLGYNGADANMVSITRRGGGCPNASANGQTVSHCRGVVSDDIVAHEWTHNYTRSLSGPIYAYESGAIDEGLADIFGETVDLLNTRGNDSGDDQLRGGCGDPNMRWYIGEDAAAFGGAIRDMHEPECFNDPGSRTSDDFVCADFSFDSGGVHVNSGVVNRAYTLLVDGGSLNGITVGAIGMTKALHIFYHANANYVGRVTDFNALAGMLLQSAEDLYGVDLPSLTLLDLAAPPSGQMISPADRQEVENALTATGMLDNNACPSVPTLAQNPPNACDDRPDLLLDQDWETGLGTWALTQAPANPATWTDQPWVLNDNLPDGRPGQAAFAANPAIGDCNADLENGTTSLTSPSFTIPVSGTYTELRFDHYYSTENNFDGGLLELSLNGAPFQIISNDAFVYNGYDDALVGPASNDNPLAGQRTFNGSDQGRLTGSWGTSVVDLTAAGAGPGDAVEVRWTMGFDGCNGWLGWYLDEVTVRSCASAALPVEWVSIGAEAFKDRIDVRWETAAESGNRGFTVERRGSDEPRFRPLGFVSPDPFGGGYVFSDRSAVAGVEYTYRVRQTDFDGNFSFSPLVGAGIALVAEALSVFPNPATDVLHIRAGGAVTAALYDPAGRLVRQMALADGRAKVPLAGLQPGLYFVRAGAAMRRVVIK